jgi:hypothetical protein
VTANAVVAAVVAFKTSLYVSVNTVPAVLTEADAATYVGAIVSTGVTDADAGDNAVVLSPLVAVVLNV